MRQIRKTHFLVCALLTLAYFPVESTATEFTVDSWSLSVVTSSGFPDTSAHVFNVVQNPFSAQHNVTHPSAPLSTAAASYDFSWNEARQLGRFLIESTQTADGNVFGETRSTTSSRINITPLTPITVQVHGEYEFSCPADFMAATFLFTAFGLSSSTTLFAELHSFTTSMGTGDGQFIIDTEFVVPATESWQLWSSMQIETGTGSFGHLAEGSGFFDIRIIPEPSTLSLLAVGSLAALRRSRQCRG